MWKNPFVTAVVGILLGFFFGLDIALGVGGEIGLMTFVGFGDSLGLPPLRTRYDSAEKRQVLRQIRFELWRRLGSRQRACLKCGKLRRLLECLQVD
jgi:hypothetical protein